MFEKRRSEKRKNLIYYLEAYDNENGELAGHVVDITAGGVMIVSESMFELDKIFSLKIILPFTIDEIDSVIFNAECVHCAVSQNKSHFDTGFKYISLDESFLAILDKLIKEYGFKS
jgi:hypothetical protein